MKDVQCYELFGGIALKNHAFSYSKNVEKHYAMNKTTSLVEKEIVLHSFCICIILEISSLLSKDYPGFGSFYDKQGCSILSTIL